MLALGSLALPGGGVRTLTAGPGMVATVKKPISFSIDGR